VLLSQNHPRENKQFPRAMHTKWPHIVHTSLLTESSII